MQEVRFTSEEWFGGLKAEYKEKGIAPFGQVPVVSIGDKHLAQTNAILRLFAKKYNIYGDTEEDQYVSDMIVDGVEDWRKGYAGVIYSSNFDNLIGDYKAKTIPTVMEQFETLLRKNATSNDGKLHFVANKLNWADILVFDMIENVTRLVPDVLDSYPALKKFHEQFRARPRIAAYLASGKRPEKNNNVPRG
eukprot:GEZU01039520.1.p2 GENE.GEZU01039520.1~~GEZU01039520.1.p2  ORF type:complete len:192 (-),score=73.92 GEZU01039520.1:23-598(-)